MKGRKEVRRQSDVSQTSPGRQQVETKAAGPQCHKCACRDFYTIEKRATYGYQNRRRLECRNCGTRITTYEAERRPRMT